MNKAPGSRPHEFSAPLTPNLRHGLGKIQLHGAHTCAPSLTAFSRGKPTTCNVLSCHAINENKIRGHVRKQEEMRRQQALERIEHERAVREERHKVWRHRTSIRLLCTSMDSLFLFFAQRIANLAGSRRTHNDALRANGEC